MAAVPRDVNADTVRGVMVRDRLSETLRERAEDVRDTMVAEGSQVLGECDKIYCISR